MEHGAFTRQEIQSQPEVWRSALGVVASNGSALRELYQSKEYQTVLFTGCGSPYYLALHAATLLRDMAGIPAQAIPASEIWLSPRSHYQPGKPALLVALSRSGTTSETLRACERFRAESSGAILTLVCNPGSPLTTLGDINLVFPAAQEQSLAQTRAFTALQVGITATIAHWAGANTVLYDLERLPDAATVLLANYSERARTLGKETRFDRFYVLGSGARYGLACELALKLKEMSISHSEPFHFLEFRHGPQTMANSTTLIIGLLSHEQRAYELAVLKEMQQRGAAVLAIGPKESDIEFDSQLHPHAAGPLYLPIGQALALEHALAKGLNPDKPEGLEAVIILPNA